jgi:hypothetical protein
MTIDYLKEKKELVSVVLLCVSAVLAVSILVKVTGFFTASARAEKIVKTAITQNTEDANDIDKYFTKYKVLADALKKNNLFAPPVAKQHPVKEVTGIFGDEVIIRDKLYKVGEKVGDATIVSIDSTQVTIEWDGKKKTFSPMDAKGSSQPSRPGGSRASARGKPPKPAGGTAQMVTIKAQGRPMDIPKVVIEKMTEKFKNMSGAERDKFMSVMKKSEEKFKKMSEEQQIQFKADMIEKFSGRKPDGGKRGGK